ncbi:beta-ketoacyl-[acyl-carrier-protein] synthase II [Thiomicrorhabdus immobilis]|uniref:Beta-ketoacyl-[acyl-carrier-protein] synthase II n=1 Tax=Thiomicrorhabdus immobilis TaxID=2791037 RepID=A0ABM7MCM9_9GAMM|nr:beta-ketoacyl-ACP synthase [Thiomicrorhabdus immobilis]BCN93101.1 beta-ketoacyl-[acyl-carrier-protein] synthase II [Thiomicrorhabdus immobilis]
MFILGSSLVSSLGQNKEAHIQALKAGTTGLSNQTDFHKRIPGINTFLGVVNDLENIQLPESLKMYTCRNNQLAWQALQENGFLSQVNQLVKKHGRHRIGLVVGTSTSGIAATEHVFRNELESAEYDYQTTQQMDSLAQFCSQALEIEGPSFAISTACSSSAKVFEVAQRWLNADIVDAVVVGGVDTLCLTTLHGFNALGLVSEQICKPLDQERNGINIGEAGGFMLLSNTQSLEESASPLIKIMGVGESSDAYHISTPHPEGEGAQLAMLAAMQQAKISMQDIDYINLHGTATPSNDLSEISAVAHLSKEASPTWVSSTKGFTGHTLGAAGITEIIFCQWLLEEQFVPANLNLSHLDPQLTEKLQHSTVNIPFDSLQLTETNQKLQYVMSNSFGFGGNNASVILKMESV